MRELLTNFWIKTDYKAPFRKVWFPLPLLDLQGHFTSCCNKLMIYWLLIF